MRLIYAIRFAPFAADACTMVYVYPPSLPDIHLFYFYIRYSNLSRRVGICRVEFRHAFRCQTNRHIE